MNKRKAIPDRLNLNVMDALQGVKTNPMVAPTREATAPITLPESIVKKPIEAQPKSAMDFLQSTSGMKTKVNLYLDTGLKRRIEQTQIDLRRIAPPDQAGQINYSMIVETALALVFDEFERTGEASSLSRQTLAQLRSK